MSRVKKVLSLCIMSFLMFNIMSCSRLNINTTDDFVMPPKVKQQYINGVWKVTDVEILDENLSGNKSKGELMKTSISFCDSMATIGSNTLMNPKTKLKKFYSNHYLLYHYDIDIEKLSLKDKDVVNVVSVYQNNNMFCEVIEIDSNNAYIYQSGVLYKAVKISDMNDKLPDVNKDGNSQKANAEQYTAVSHSYDSPCGVLIGLKGRRYKDDSTNEIKQDYKTLWISFDNNKLNPVLEKKDLFIPRLKGFTVLSVDQYHTLSGNARESINFTNVINEAKEKTSDSLAVNNNMVNGSNAENMTKSKQKYIDILFVSNDYLSAQYYEGYSFTEIYDQIRTLPIDNPNMSTGISIDDLGKNALKSYQDSVKALNARDKKSYKSDPESFGLVRQNGYWALKARVSEGKNYHEFDLNLLPTKKFIVYDRLCVGWSVIKDRVPNALDAITSPTSRIAVVMTANKLLVYEIKNGELDREPLKTIDLMNGEKMVMAEWANNEFVDYWTKSFKSYGSYKEVTNED